MNETTEPQAAAEASGSRHDLLVQPDFISTVEWTTFHGSSIPEAIRKCATWIEQSGLEFDNNIDHMVISYDYETELFKAQIPGFYLPRETIGSLRLGKG